MVVISDEVHRRAKTLASQLGGAARLGEESSKQVFDNAHIATDIADVY